MTFIQDPWGLAVLAGATVRDIHPSNFSVNSSWANHTQKPCPTAPIGLCTVTVSSDCLMALFAINQGHLSVGLVTEHPLLWVTPGQAPGSWHTHCVAHTKVWEPCYTRELKGPWVIDS